MSNQTKQEPTTIITDYIFGMGSYLEARNLDYYYPYENLKCKIYFKKQMNSQELFDFATDMANYLNVVYNNI
jgi:hypothetical protein